MIGWLTGILWLFTILVPEYCLGLMADTDDMGTPTLGKLIALISILPVAFLLPFAVFYWLQYLGRVVVASGMGETTPPRTPDRNFGGFLTGISPWFTWLFLGLGVGLLPAGVFRALLELRGSRQHPDHARPRRAWPPLHSGGVAHDVFARPQSGRDTPRRTHCDSSTSAGRFYSFVRSSPS